MKLPDAALVWVVAALLVVAGFWVTYQFVEPAPPGTIRMATGTVDGAYHRFAERYQGPLAAQGIQLELVPSAGAVENLSLLTQGEDPVDLAFVQGGLDTAGLDGELASLGSVHYEPIWVFHRRTIEVGSLEALCGLRIGIGRPGSGTQAVARTLLNANGVGPEAAARREIDFNAGADALIRGDLDALFVIAAPTASVIDRLVASDQVALMGFARAEAYVRRFRYMSMLELPEGVMDLAANKPDQNVRLLAVTANLVARKDLHPALVDLILKVARQVHGSPDIFEKANEFPSPDHAILPLDDDAERFYRYGPPFLQRYLPFWAATLVDRLKILLLPLIALLIPLGRAMPPVYQWRVRSRVYRWYGDLQNIDPRRFEAVSDDTAIASRLEALNALEDEVNRVRVPLSYTDEFYHLRGHIDMVRRDLEARAAASARDPDGAEPA